MKREIEREVRLPAFELHLGELELLWQRLFELFDAKEEINSSINLSLPSEKLQFDSIAELKEYGQLRGRVTKFSLRLSQGGRSVSLKTGGLFNNFPTLKAEAESDVWCAGAVEAVMRVVRANRLWYSWFIFAPLGLIFFLVAVTPALMSWLLPRFGAMPTPVTLVWLAVLVLFGILWFAKDRVLPAAALTFTTELGFVRRYGAELGLALGVLSILLALYTWLYPHAVG